MKRIIISLLLLTTVFLMSGLFTGETHDSVRPALISTYAASQDAATSQQPFSESFLHVTDETSSHPTLALVLWAALASSLTMATFIYGSRFIATLVAG